MSLFLTVPWRPPPRHQKPFWHPTRQSSVLAAPKKPKPLTTSSPYHKAFPHYPPPRSSQSIRLSRTKTVLPHPVPATTDHYPPSPYCPSPYPATRRRSCTWCRCLPHPRRPPPSVPPTLRICILATGPS